MSQPVTPEEVLARLEGHEELCTERTANIRKDILALKGDIKTVRNIVISSAGGVICALAVIAWALLAPHIGVH